MKTGKIFLLICLVFFVIYLFSGIYGLSTLNEDIAGKIGEVWNMSKRATEVLSRLEGQVKVYLKDRQDLIEKITVARNDILAANKKQDFGKLESSLGGVQKAIENTQLAIKVTMEQYPNTDLGELQKGLMDETAGSINRLAYARDQLIQLQVDFNKKRIFYFIVQPFFPRKDVIGERVDPMQDLPPSEFK